MTQRSWADEWEISLAAGPLGASVQCNAPEIIRFLKLRYGPFQSSHPASIRLKINIGQVGKPGSHLDQEYRLTGETLVYDSKGVNGIVDLSRGEGELQINTENPVVQIDYLLRVVFAFMSVRQGGIILHSAGVIHKRAGYVFLGPSGTGKTTIARLSEKLSDTLVMNDDLIYLCPVETGWYLHSTPFTNPGQVQPTPAGSYLRAVFCLEQSTQVSLSELQTGQAIAQIVANIPVVPLHEPYTSQVLKTVDALVKQVPVYLLDFRPDSSFWQLIDQQVQGLPDGTGKSYGGN